MSRAIVSSESLYYAPSAWKAWIDYISQNKMLAARRVALVRQSDCSTASATPGFVLAARDVMGVSAFFSGNSADRLVIRSKTYMLKSCSSVQIVAFNGSRYIIVTRSKSMYLVAKCLDKSKVAKCAEACLKLAKHLIAKNFWCVTAIYNVNESR